MSNPRPTGRRGALHAVGAAARAIALASVWHAISRAGQGKAPRVLRVGVLGINKPPGDPRVLHAALAEYGWVEGKNLAFEARWADGDATRLPALAAELVQIKPDMILALTTSEAHAAKQATTTIPIILFGAGGDPVASGLVASLARPGGNITGLVSMTAEQGVKRLELLKEVLPSLSKVAWLSGSQTTEATRKALHTTAAALRIELVTLEVRSEAEITAAIAGARAKGIQALTHIPSPLLRIHNQLIAELALGQRLPYAGLASDADRGALLGFSSDNSFVMSRGAWIIDRVARGAKPGDLAIERPTRFSLTVNLKTARALDIKLTPGFRSKVDRTVE